MITHTHTHTCDHATTTSCALCASIVREGCATRPQTYRTDAPTQEGTTDADILLRFFLTTTPSGRMKHKQRKQQAKLNTTEPKTMANTASWLRSSAGHAHSEDNVAPRALVGSQHRFLGHAMQAPPSASARYEPEGHWTHSFPPPILYCSSVPFGQRQTKLAPSATEMKPRLANSQRHCEYADDATGLVACSGH